MTESVTVALDQKGTRSVVITGDRAHVAEAVAAYCAGRDMVRSRLKPKQYAKLIQGAALELWGGE